MIKRTLTKAQTKELKEKIAEYYPGDVDTVRMLTNVKRCWGVYQLVVRGGQKPPSAEELLTVPGVLDRKIKSLSLGGSMADVKSESSGAARGKVKKDTDSAQRSLSLKDELKGEISPQGGHVTKRRGRGPGKGVRKVPYSFQVEEEMLDKLKEVAEEEERTVSAVLRIAIKQFIKNKG